MLVKSAVQQAPCQQEAACPVSAANWEVVATICGVPILASTLEAAIPDAASGTLGVCTAAYNQHWWGQLWLGKGQALQTASDVPGPWSAVCTMLQLNQYSKTGMLDFHHDDDRIVAKGGNVYITASEGHKLVWDTDDAEILFSEGLLYCIPAKLFVQPYPKHTGSGGWIMLAR